MAEHTYDGPVELGAEMDYPAHERSYDAFVTVTKLSIVGTLNVLLSLVLYAYGSGGFWLGTLLLIMAVVAASVGIAGRGSIKPSAIVFVIGILLVAIATG